jgi:hypothetical protein
MNYSIPKEIEDNLRSSIQTVIIPHQPPLNTTENKEYEESIISNFNEYLNKIRFSKNIQKEKMGITSYNDLSVDEDSHLFDSDSPITMDSFDIESLEDKKEDEDEEDKEEEEEDKKDKKQIYKYLKTKKFKKLTYKEVEQSLGFYENNENKCLNELDILITYLKGQTNLYSLSQYLTQQKINVLTIPSFVFSIVVTVLAPLIHDYYWSGILISALTASIAALFGCVRYYELDAGCISYLYLTNQYNKMQLSLETINNSLVMGFRGSINIKEVTEKIRDVEQKITEIRDSNSFLPPEEVKLLIPIISHVNIFSFIKKIRTMKKNIISKYLDIKNEIRFILHQWGVHSNDDYDDYVSSHDIDYHLINDSNMMIKDGNHHNESFSQHVWKKKQQQMKREKKRLTYLLKKKTELRNELSYYHTAYTYMDELFTREICLADHTNNWWVILRWFLGFKPESLPQNNPIVDKYLEFIFFDNKSKNIPFIIPKKSYTNDIEIV